MNEEEIKNQNPEQQEANDNPQNEAAEEQPVAEGKAEEIENEAAEAEELDPLTAAQREAAEWEKKFYYKMAEFDNYRKRTIKEKAELILNGAEKTVVAMLPVVDDMERALANGDKTEDVEALREGMQLIYKKMLKALESLGVHKIDTDGKDFDVEYHEAIAMVPGVGDEQKGKVIDCVATGYTLNDKVIRYAKVAVGQ